MSITKLQRYYVTRNDAAFPHEEGDYCLTDDVTELEATNAELVKALEELLDKATCLIYDHDEWGPEDHETIIAARKALDSARSE